jgi:hypothetical protein
MELMQASNQWATRPADQRFKTLNDLRASVHGRRTRSRSMDVELSTIKSTLDADTGALVFNGQISPATPSHWGFGQFAGMLKAPGNYLRTLPPPLVVECFNHGLKSADRSAVKFMTIANETGPATLQAVTSPTYGRVWDADVVDAVSRVVEKSNGKFHNPLAYARGSFGSGETEPSGLYASDHDVFIFMIDGGSILEVGERAQLNRGFFVWNSETGARTFGLTTFLFNKVCGNHIVWGAQDVNNVVIRHTKNGPTRFDTEAAPALLEYVNASAAPEVAAIKRAQAYMLPRRGDGTDTDGEKLASLVKPFNFTKTELHEATQAAKREEGDCRTLWQLVQGLTAYARGFDFIDSRVDLEKRAGSLLNLVKE